MTQVRPADYASAAPGVSREICAGWEKADPAQQLAGWRTRIVVERRQTEKGGPNAAKEKCEWAPVESNLRTWVERFCARMRAKPASIRGQGGIESTARPVERTACSGARRRPAYRPRKLDLPLKIRKRAPWRVLAHAPALSPGKRSQCTIPLVLSQSGEIAAGRQQSLAANMFSAQSQRAPTQFWAERSRVDGARSRPPSTGCSSVPCVSIRSTFLMSPSVGCVVMEIAT
jgi:hypothetical protein